MSSFWSKKFFTRGLIVFLVSLLAVSVFISAGLSVVKGAETNDSISYWKTLAGNAWNYFAPGVGVDAQTGLPHGDVDYAFYTDWDLGFYVQAIMDAQKIGLIERTGAWGADDRIDKVLTCLENRPLMANGLPYTWYSATSYNQSVNEAQVATDTGKLLVALKNIETFDPALKDRVDNIVFNHTNYEPRRISVDILLNQTLSGKRAANIYDYYVTRGFAGFWPERFSAEADGILDFITSTDKIDYEGVLLPKAEILCDPLMMSILEFDNNSQKLMDLSRQIYLAQEARFNVTGHYTAFSEGSTGVDGIPFAYEWITLADGRMWVSQIVSQSGVKQEVSMTPITYLKAAVGLQAIYNTPYTQGMVNYLLTYLPNPVKGYNQGIDESGRVLISNNMGVANGFLVTAARYSIENNVVVPNPMPVTESTPSPSSSSSSSQSSQSSSVSSTPSPQVENKPLATPKPTPVPTINATSPAVNSTSLTLRGVTDTVPTEVYVVVGAVVMGLIVAVTVLLSRKSKAVSEDNSVFEEIDLDALRFARQL